MCVFLIEMKADYSSVPRVMLIPAGSRVFSFKRLVSVFFIQSTKRVNVSLCEAKLLDKRTVGPGLFVAAGATAVNSDTFCNCCEQSRVCLLGINCS